MKKCVVALSSVLLAGAVFAADVAADEPIGKTYPVAVDVVSPLQLPGANDSVCGLRLNLLYGKNRDVCGVDLGLVSRAAGNQRGLQLGGFNWDENAFCGFQGAAVGNIVGSDACGLQLSTALNLNQGAFCGVQVALFNWDHTFTGVQAGLANRNYGLSHGVQLGLVNVDLNEYAGVSFGAINNARTFTGVQCGLFNAADSMTGLQIGLFNGATALTGVQIGVLNVAGNAKLAILPIFNGNF